LTWWSEATASRRPSGHLAVGVADPAAQVSAMDLDQLERRQVPHPQKRRQLRLARVLGELACDLQVRLLEHVGIIDAARQSTTEPQLDHPLQPIPVSGE
jgi:hypothetical protein